MSRNGRKALIRRIERVAAALLLADLAVYFVLVLGLGNRLRAAQEHRETLYRQARSKQMRIARLEQYQSSLPDAKERLAQFEKEHVPSRRQGFSSAARLIRKVAEQSGVQLSGLSYKLDSDEKQPFKRLAIIVSAEGPFRSLVSFAHALETAGEFIIVREFNYQPGEGEALALRMNADLYLGR